jgi:hypothetical protein
MSRIYRRIYEDYHGVKIPKGYHIHHIDYDRTNNDPLNLEMLTPDEHAKKHGYLNNFIMAQERARNAAIKKLKTNEMREKMRESMKNSSKHKEAMEKRKQNEEWREQQAERARHAAKVRTNEPWNKGKKGVQVPWNKGLTKETDERVKKYIENREKKDEKVY